MWKQLELPNALGIEANSVTFLLLNVETVRIEANVVGIEANAFLIKDNSVSILL